VLVLGIWAAAIHINRLLDSSPDRWSFIRTWFLLLAHVGVPLVLFWFLDYTDALHDTSLFAAITVAVAYRQIFAGGVQGIMMPGQTPALWKPFEAWVSNVSNHIEAKSILWRIRFNERLRDHLGADPNRLSALRELAYKNAQDQMEFLAQLNCLQQKPKPALITQAVWERSQASNETQFLLKELRKAYPEDYGYFLMKHGIINRLQYRFWLGNTRAKCAAWGGAFVLFLVVISLGVTFNDCQLVHLHYYQWRFTKPNTTEADRFRTYEYLRNQLCQMTNNPSAAQSLLGPLLTPLQYKELSADSAKEIIQIVMTFHSPPLDGVIIPQLMDAVRTENPTVRMAVHQTLKDLQAADYPNYLISSNLITWKPADNAPPAEIDNRAHAWQEWWQRAKK